MADSVAFISDLHGNLVALEAVLAAIEKAGVDRVVCLGDIVDLGPQQDECVQRLIADGVQCIQGNHDPLTEEPVTPELGAIQAWSVAQLSDDSRAFLAGLPDQLELELEGSHVLCVHGSPRNVVEGLEATTTDEQLDQILAGAQKFDAVVGGHTHVQMLRRRNHQTIVNVGSVGMPFRETFSGKPPSIMKWAEYGVLRVIDDSLHVELCRQHFDFDAFVQSCHDSGFPEAGKWLQYWIDTPTS